MIHWLFSLATMHTINNRHPTHKYMIRNFSVAKAAFASHVKILRRHWEHLNDLQLILLIIDKQDFNQKILMKFFWNDEKV